MRRLIGRLNLTIELLSILIKEGYFCGSCGDNKTGYVGQANQILVFGTCPSCGKHLHHISING